MQIKVPIVTNAGHRLIVQFFILIGRMHKLASCRLAHAPAHSMEM